MIQSVWMTQPINILSSCDLPSQWNDSYKAIMIIGGGEEDDLDFALRQ